MQRSSLNRIELDISQVIQDLKSQKVLFGKKINRYEILNIKIPQQLSSTIYVNVWRNHTFELMQDLICPYFSVRGASIEFKYSGYDNTLSFHNHADCDIELIWFDPTGLRDSLRGITLINWLIERIKSLRCMSYCPILVATWFETKADTELFESKVQKLNDVYYADVNRFCKTKNLSAIDERTYALTGTRISKDACLNLAKEFGCKWLSGLVLPPVKAIATDLDNTLYNGVLGEDEIDGIQLGPVHIKLQNYLKSLKESGVFLALVSRNKKQDVEELFRQRKDFRLKWEDFSATEVSWGSKSKAIENIANTLNIGVDSILFIDDNVGELLEVKNKFPEIPQILASPNGNSTLNSIGYFPGLWRWKLDDEDNKRIEDLKGNLRRSELSEITHTKKDYLKNLQVKITARVDDYSKLSRMSALSNKTNQFNLTFGRFKEVEILEKLQSQNYCVVCINLTDVVSDSGIIGLVIGKIYPSFIEIEEVCISCRAMGRGVENYLILWAIKNIPSINDVDYINFNVVRGQRNEPAISWISSLLNKKNSNIERREKVKVCDLFSLSIPSEIITEVYKNG